MKDKRLIGLPLTIAAVASLYCFPAFATAPTTVQVQEAEGPSDYGITLNQSDFPAGPVAFKVINDSKALDHEFVVAKTDLPADKLPYDKAAATVDEGKVDVMGEVDDLKPGNAGSRTFNLEPGRYVAFCNVPGHYKLGMYTTFTVEPK